MIPWLELLAGPWAVALASGAALAAAVEGDRKELNVKVVFCGPSAGVAERVLRALHGALNADAREPLEAVTLEDGSQAIACSFTPPSRGSGASALRFHLYAASAGLGGLEPLLKGADAIVFSAEGGNKGAKDAAEALHEVQGALRSQGRLGVPFVCLVEHGEGTEKIDEAELRTMWGLATEPIVDTGAVDAFKAVMHQVSAGLRGRVTED
ncbi:MAG TPA: hypothetical protein VFS43_01700 [Polyangiaceae bacterium]|nr:hypothetical protein [Polyangiaceae bacterium]